MKGDERRRVAEEAARLLYCSIAREYKQAKEEAARNLNVKVFPSNFEVAVELDKMADDAEGVGREKLIVDLRRDALKIMKRLKAFHPRLIGSVWRGTARKGSDIDIEVFSQNPELVAKAIEDEYEVLRVEHAAKTLNGKTDRFLHIYFKPSPEYEVDIAVNGLERIRERRRCDVYGDLIVGLTLHQLEKILEENPHKRFIPKRR